MDKIRNDKILAFNLRRLRNDCALTQEQVVAQMQVLGCQDISRSIYSRYETGELNIKRSHLAALTKVFHCDYNTIFEKK